LIINHYEIKEIRDLQLEEIRDKRDWEKYKAVNGGFQWNHLTSQPNLTHIIQQLLQLIQQQQQSDQTKRSGGPGQDRRQYPNQRQNTGDRKPYPQQQRPGNFNNQGNNMHQGMPQQPQMQQQMRGMPQ